MGNILFENDITVVEASDSPGNCRCLVVTFSSFGDNDPSAPGFGQDFLEKNGCFVVAVKKRADNWYRDISPELFAEILMPLRSGFERCFTYGASMGGYAALYFGSAIDAEPIAISPRNSVDPRFALPEFARFVNMSKQHHSELSHVANPAIRPRVVYDPKVKSDLAYIDREVRPAFPNGSYTGFPFSGHPSAEAMLNIGQLKPFVLGALDGHPPLALLSSRASKRRSGIILNEMSKWNHSRKRLERARLLSDLALSIGGERKEFLYQQGSLLMAAGKLLEALDLTRRTIDTHGGSASLFHRIASLSFRLDDLEGAVDAADAGLQISPGNLGLLRTRRNTLQKLKRFDGALADALVIIEVQTANTSDRLHLASILMAQQAYAEAVHHLDIVLSQEQNLLAMRRRCTCLESLKRPHDALEAAAEIVSLAGDNIPDIIHLVDLCVQTGDLGRAIEALQLGIEFAPGNLTLHRRIRNHLAEAGRIDEAVEAAAAVLVIAPDSDIDAATLNKFRTRQRRRRSEADRRAFLLHVQRTWVRIPSYFLHAEPIAIFDAFLSSM